MNKHQYWMWYNKLDTKLRANDGNWKDYWTKETVRSGWFEVKSENIPVFEKY